MGIYGYELQSWMEGKGGDCIFVSFESGEKSRVVGSHMKFKFLLTATQM